MLLTSTTSGDVGCYAIAGVGWLGICLWNLVFVNSPQEKYPGFQNLTNYHAVLSKALYSHSCYFLKHNGK